MERSEAPGNKSPINQALKGRDNQQPNPFALSGLGVLLGHFPRALPWAISFCPFRANAYRKDFPVSELNHQFDKLTDRSKGTPVPELAEGALTKPYIYTVAYASGSERGVLFPWLISTYSSFRVSASVFSVFVRG